MTDCRPVSVISTQTVGALSGEVGKPLDQRRFRANIYLDLGAAAGSAEDAFVGRRLKIGAKAVIAVLERDPRHTVRRVFPSSCYLSPTSAAIPSRTISSTASPRA